MANKTNENNKVKTKVEVTEKRFKLWVIYMLLFCLAILVAWFCTSLLTKKYKAEAEISVKKEVGLNIENARQLNLSLRNQLAFYEVIEEFGLSAEVFSKSSLSKTLLYKNAPVKIKIKDFGELKSTEDIPFQYNQYFVIIGDKGYPFNKWVSTPYGKLMFLRNSVFGEQKKKVYYFSLHSLKETMASLDRSLKISEVKDSVNRLLVSVTDENPERAKDILNYLITRDLKTAKAEHDLLAVNTAKFINSQIELLEQQLLASEQKMKQFASAQSVEPFTKVGSDYLQHVAKDGDNIAETSVRLLLLDRLEAFARSSGTKDAIIPRTAGITDPQLTKMVKDLFQRRATQQQLNAVVEVDSLMLSSNNSEEKKLTTKLLTKINVLRNSLKSILTSSTNAANSYSSALNSLSEQEKNFVYLNRQKQINTNIYTFLLQLKAETALSFVTSGTESIENVENVEKKILKGAEIVGLSMPFRSGIIYFISLGIAAIIGIGFTTLRKKSKRITAFGKEQAE